MWIRFCGRTDFVKFFLVFLALYTLRGILHLLSMHAKSLYVYADESYIVTASVLMNESRENTEGLFYPEGRIWGYPAVLAFLWWLCGGNDIGIECAMNVVVIVQILATAFACAVAGTTVAHFTGREWLKWALAGLWLVWGWYPELYVASESLYRSLTVVSLCALLAGIEKKDSKLLWLAGLLACLAYLMRPVALSWWLFVFLLLVALRCLRPQFLPAMGVVGYGIPVAVAVGCWSTYVYRTTGKWTVAQSDPDVYFGADTVVQPVVKAISLAGMVSRYREIGGELITWWEVPREIACLPDTLFYYLPCYDEQKILSTLQKFTTSSFSVERLRHLRDSLINAKFFSQGIPDSTLRLIKGNIRRSLLQWLNQLKTEKPHWIITGRVKLLFRYLFPPPRVNLKKGILHSLFSFYHLLSALMQYAVSGCAIIAVLLLLASKSPQHLLTTSEVTKIIGLAYGWCPILAHILWLVVESRYFAPQYHIFMVVLLLIFFGREMRSSTPQPQVEAGVVPRPPPQRWEA